MQISAQETNQAHARSLGGSPRMERLGSGSEASTARRNIHSAANRTATPVPVRSSSKRRPSLPKKGAGALRVELLLFLARIWGGYKNAKQPRRFGKDGARPKTRGQFYRSIANHSSRVRSRQTI